MDESSRPSIPPSAARHPAGATPPGVRWTVAFFMLGGVLETALGVWDAPRPLQFWPVWDALGRGLMHGILGYALWMRLASARTLAIVYCITVVILYLVVIALALAQAPFDFPDSVVVQSLYQVPSCVLLLPYLRSARASADFPRPLFAKHPPSPPPPAL